MPVLNERGRFELSKSVALLLALLSLATFIWSVFATYVMQTTVKPMEQRITRLEVGQAELRKEFDHRCVEEEKRAGELNAILAAISAKQDLLLDMAKKNR